jgi:AcrR family transcriptional regulator
MRRIAAAADLQAGSLYFHFRTKDDLVAATLADGVESARVALLSAIDSVPPNASPTDHLRGHLDALHASDDRAAGHPPCAKRLLSSSWAKQPTPHPH